MSPKPMILNLVQNDNVSAKPVLIQPRLTRFWGDDVETSALAT